MPSDYENETCGGCEWFSEFSGPMCTKQETETNAAYEGGRDCEHFKRSLACRAVRAAERANELKEREVAALECIAGLGFEAFAKYVGGQVTQGE